MPTKPAFALAIPALTLGLGLLAGKPSQPSQGVLLLPPAWVAFKASVEITSSQGVSSGTFWRASNGSTSTVLNTPAGTTVNINNIERLLQYKYLPGEGWLSQPIALKHPYLPPPRFNNLAQATSLPNKYEGRFEVYELCTGGFCSWNLPELNWHPVRTEHPYGVVTSEFKNIILTEPSTDVLVPPTGVTVRALSTPGGIIEGR